MRRRPRSSDARLMVQTAREARCPTDRAARIWPDVEIAFDLPGRAPDEQLDMWAVDELFVILRIDRAAIETGDLPPQNVLRDRNDLGLPCVVIFGGSRDATDADRPDRLVGAQDFRSLLPGPDRPRSLRTCGRAGRRAAMADHLARRRKMDHLSRFCGGGGGHAPQESLQHTPHAAYCKSKNTYVSMSPSSVAVRVEIGG